MRAVSLMLPLLVGCAASNPSQFPLLDRAMQSGALVVRAGERWTFAVENGAPVAARPLDADALPEAGRLVVELSGTDGKSIMTITNNTPAWLNYRARIVLAGSDKAALTSVCTLMGDGRKAFEHWPQTIQSIELSDFSPAEAGTMTCR